MYSSMGVINQLRPIGPSCTSQSVPWSRGKARLIWWMTWWNLHGFHPNEFSVTPWVYVNDWRVCSMAYVRGYRHKIWRYIWNSTSILGSWRSPIDMWCIKQLSLHHRKHGPRPTWTIYIWVGKPHMACLTQPEAQRDLQLLRLRCSRPDHTTFDTCPMYLRLSSRSESGSKHAKKKLADCKVCFSFSTTVEEEARLKTSKQDITRCMCF